LLGRGRPLHIDVMCGRFTRNYNFKQIQEYLNLIPSRAPSNFPPDFNVCPTDPIDAVVQTYDGRELQQMRWGIIPAWWSKPIKEMKMATFNARAETVDTKPMFKTAFKRNRCIIPATGYYEWQTIGKEKQPWYFTPKDAPLLAFAGIWDEWQDRENKITVKSCAMIITEPSKFVSEVHDRMPVILGADQFEPWLTGVVGKEVLDPAPEDVLQRWPVSKRVNSSRAEKADATLVDRITVGR
jgi:putative SOS response-associated peptidase YedK